MCPKVVALRCRSSSAARPGWMATRWPGAERPGRCPASGSVRPRFEPSAGKHAGQTCYGVQIHVTDRTTLQPVRTGLHLVATLKACYPGAFRLGQLPAGRWDFAVLH